jgi:4-carboxymuconolactone decarboxylase
MNDELFERGRQIRSEVLGATTRPSFDDDFSRPLMEVAFQYCWGENWDRPGLDRRTRSLTVLAAITAWNRPAELKLHVRGALNNGVTKTEIQEVFLQSAFYCGIPAAAESFKIAKEVFAEMGV